ANMDILRCRFAPHSFTRAPHRAALWWRMGVRGGHVGCLGARGRSGRDACREGTKKAATLKLRIAARSGPDGIGTCNLLASRVSQYSAIFGQKQHLASSGNDVY